ncbi:MAG: hypothetical protein KC621_08205 [Myxococcales bacterium]|nr:hypothetical protein [Myxococcales bacterium]
MPLPRHALAVVEQITDHHLGVTDLAPLVDAEVDADILTNLVDDLDETFGLEASDDRWRDVHYGGLAYLLPILERSWDGHTLRFVDGGAWIRPSDR